MGNKVFLNKKFSNYLGEQRALLDIVVRYEDSIPPTPTATAVPSTPTPTPTASSIPPTQTPTPQVTSTPTPSASPIVQDFLLFESGDIIETEQGDLLEPNL